MKLEWLMLAPALKKNLEFLRSSLISLYICFREKAIQYILVVLNRLQTEDNGQHRKLYALLEQSIKKYIISRMFTLLRIIFLEMEE